MIKYHPFCILFIGLICFNVGSLISSPLSSSSSPPPLADPLVLVLDVIGKDMNMISFAFSEKQRTVCQRAYQCLTRYIFPPKNDQLFAFYHARAILTKVPLPAHLDGWQLYDIVYVTIALF